MLAELKHDGIDHLALEASSHGLDQYRLDGVEIAAVGFTNITRDHMDYHPTFEALSRLQAAAVQRSWCATAASRWSMPMRNMPIDFSPPAKARGLRAAHGRRERATDLKLVSRAGRIDGQTLKLAL